MFKNSFKFPRVQWIYVMPGVGISCFLALYIHKKRMEPKFEHEIIKRVLQCVREDPELMTMLGGDFRVRTNLLSMIFTRMKFEGHYGESRFVLASPAGSFNFNFNANSQTYASILASNRPAVNKAKFSIPDQTLIDQIRSVENPEMLKNIPLDPEKRFWAIDHMSLTNRDRTVIRKPSIVLNLDVQRPNYKTLFDVFQDLRKAETSRENPPTHSLSAANSSGIVNFRMRQTLEKRTSIMLSSLYLGFMFTIVIFAQSRRWINTTLANHIFFLRAKFLLKQAFPAERHLIINRTSLDGLYLNKARFQMQFSGQDVAGTGFFTLTKESSKVWVWTEARFEYRTPDQIHMEKVIDIADLKEGVEWVDKDPTLGEDKEEETEASQAAQTPPAPAKGT